MNNHLAALAAWYETLSPQTLSQLPHFYAETVRFKDPFNEVQGHAAINRIMVDMFIHLEQPRFTIHSQIAQGQQGFLAWDFHFLRAGRPWTIRGSTHLIFADDGRVAVHRDYWDAAEELYEKLPVLGFLLRRIKQVVKS